MSADPFRYEADVTPEAVASLQARANVYLEQDQWEPCAVTESQNPSPIVRPFKSHAEHKVRPRRVEMLAEAMSLTWGERDKEYGDPMVNLSCAGELKAIMRKWTRRDIGPAEREALDMIATKLARLLTGTPKPDTYIDGSAFFAIAGEVAERDGSV